MIEITVLPKSRDDILALQESMMKMEQVDCPVTHHHTVGNYAREIFIPSGTVVVGKIHKHPHVNVISQGTCIVVTEDGMVELSAPLTFISKEGTKRTVLALTDVIWTTVHPTESTDLEEIEQEVIATDYIALEEFRMKRINGESL